MALEARTVFIMGQLVLVAGMLLMVASLVTRQWIELDGDSEGIFLGCSPCDKLSVISIDSMNILLNTVRAFLLLGLCLGLVAFFVTVCLVRSISQLTTTIIRGEKMSVLTMFGGLMVLCGFAAYYIAYLRDARKLTFPLRPEVGFSLWLAGAGGGMFILSGFTCYFSLQAMLASDEKSDAADKNQPPNVETMHPAQHPIGNSNRPNGRSETPFYEDMPRLSENGIRSSSTRPWQPPPYPPTNPAQKLANCNVYTTTPGMHSEELSFSPKDRVPLSQQNSLYERFPEYHRLSSSQNENRARYSHLNNSPSSFGDLHPQTSVRSSKNTDTSFHMKGEARAAPPRDNPYYQPNSHSVFTSRNYSSRDLNPYRQQSRSGFSQTTKNLNFSSYPSPLHQSNALHRSRDVTLPNNTHYSHERESADSVLLKPSAFLSRQTTARQAHRPQPPPPSGASSSGFSTRSSYPRRDPTNGWVLGHEYF
ncbi:uncharacterized protein LOC106012068 [Aplysia californica]|uniref:Uncharacterized protein LOC106012068 n=1 Tax=Aplysia californica TaxID=6500 RepID=A0ABM1VUY0_APLCA|nr:uncharacterized protein LOC106012068 [Aplysia californica]